MKQYALWALAAIWESQRISACLYQRLSAMLGKLSFPFASQLSRSFIGFIILIWRRFLRGSLSNFIFLLFNFGKFHIHIRTDFTPYCPCPLLSYFSHSCWAFLPSNCSTPLPLCIFYDGDCMQVARNGMCLLLHVQSLAFHRTLFHLTLFHVSAASSVVSWESKNGCYRCLV